MKVITAIVRVLIAVLFIYYIVAFIWSVAGRIGYPYELEYYEGSTYLHTQRVLDGQGLFVSPDEGFIPYPYTPLYYYAMVPFTWIFGQGILAGRVLSLVSLLLSGLMIWKALYQETRSRLAGLFAFGMFISLYYITGAWLDICRIDVFLCMTFVGTVYFLKDFPSKKMGLIPSALFLIASAFTKQVGVIFLIFIFPFLYRRDKKAACIYFLGVLVTIAAMSGIANVATHGWFAHYIYQVPQNRPFQLWRFTQLFLLDDIAGKIPILFLGSVAWVFIRKTVSKEHSPLTIWEWTLPAAILASALGRSQPGGFENNLLPLFLWCSIMFGFFIYHLPQYFDRLIGSTDSEDIRRQRVMQRLIIYNFLLAQLILVFYIPTVTGFPRKIDHSVIPVNSDRKAGENLLKYVRSFPGEVYLPVHNYYGWLAGKTPGLIASSAMEHLQSGGAPPKMLFSQLADHIYDAIILNEELPTPKLAMSYERVIEENYYWAGEIPYESSATFLPVTGLRTRPNIVLLPIQILDGVEGVIVGKPFGIKRDGIPHQVFLTDKGVLHFLNTDTFTLERIEIPFPNARIIGVTNDGTIAILTTDSIFLLRGENDFTAIQLPVMENPPQDFLTAVDPLGEFILVGDSGSGLLYTLDISTGDILDTFNAGVSGRIIISSDGDNVYLKGKTMSSLDLKEGGVNLQRYVIDRKGGEIHLLQAAKTDAMNNWGNELILSPKGDLFWFNNHSYEPPLVFDASTLEFKYKLRGRGWITKDIDFGADPDKLYIHFAMPDFAGVAIINPDEFWDFGQAHIYYKAGDASLVTGSDDIVVFSTGTNIVTKFRMYPRGSWPGEQGFSPKGVN